MQEPIAQNYDLTPEEAIRLEVLGWVIHEPGAHLDADELIIRADKLAEWVMNGKPETEITNAE